jgi:hypothetical protein
MSNKKKTSSLTIRFSEKEWAVYRKIYKLLGFKTFSEFIVAAMEHGIQEVLENKSIQEQYNLKVIERLSEQAQNL